jgi:hypothetical protein
MAKTQNLSLNPTKISGTCGRLMCCLKYEQDAYEDLLRTSPKAESFVDTPDGRGTVVEVDLLRQRVKVRLEDQPETIVIHPNAEIAVLRSGKAKKTDAPIPADLAPISGSSNRIKREEPEERKLTLEPVRFRAKEGPEEIPEPVEEDVAVEPENKPSRRRNRKNRGQRKEAQPAQEAPKQEQKAAEPAPAGEKKRNNRRRRYRHRPKGNSENKSAE